MSYSHCIYKSNSSPHLGMDIVKDKSKYYYFSHSKNFTGSQTMYSIL